MTYEELLAQAPFSVPQEQKEAWYCELFSQLTRFHREHCVPYGRLLHQLGTKETFCSVEEIPMIPIGSFKKYQLASVKKEQIFKTITSSGTTGQQVSRIFLDERTAQNQQKTLYRILEERLGEQRIPMLILDSPEVLKNREMFSARGAGILGFSIVSSRRKYAFDADMKLDIAGIKEFLEQSTKGTVLVFGFTYMIWKYFYQALIERNETLPLSNGIMIHGGGWKKMGKQAVTRQAFREGIRKVSGIRQIYDYYGMAEQTGCIYLECECGHLHASTYSDILIRDMEDFSVCGVGKEGVIQVLSPMAVSYPGHSILTQDQGILLGVDDCPCGRKGKYFKMTGRIKEAEVRGCSDTYEG